MLFAGTTTCLWDLDRSYALAQDCCVTALSGSDGQAWVLFDGERVELVGEYDVAPVATLDPPNGQCLAVLPSGEIVIGRAGAKLALVRPGRAGALEAIDAFEAVPGREEWHNPAGSTPDLRSVAADAGGRLFVNVHVGGLWLSDDLGAHWTASIEPEADVHEVTTGPGGTIGVAAAGGFGWSTDRGATWQWTAEGLHASYCRAVALDGEAVYVTASTGHSTKQAAVFRAQRPGDPFVKCAGGLPEWFPGNIDTGALSASQGAIAFGTRGGEVWLSRDDGGTFEKIAFEIGPVTAVRFV